VISVSFVGLAHTNISSANQSALDRYIGLFTEQAGVAVAILSFIREVYGSNLGRPNE
jgi:hypothetical protein